MENTEESTSTGSQTARSGCQSERSATQEQSVTANLKPKTSPRAPIVTPKEYHSFSDLIYSKGKSISSISWMPGKHGIVAAACSETKSFDERIHFSGKPSSSYVLVWGFSDPIHPQIKLESASDIFSLRFNPSKPGLIAGGCHNGQNGEILQADINSENEKNLVKSVYEGHYGPIRALQHSPFFEDIILSIDVWTFSLWKERCVKPMFTSRSAEGYLTTGCWSPSRPGVIYIGLIDGIIEVWDLLDHSHQPSVKVSIGSCQVSSMEFSPTTSPQLLAVGDIQGILHIMQIPRRLSKMQYKENLVMQKFFDRQLAWAADVERQTSERAKEAEKIHKTAASKKEREEKLLKCCTWTKEMELEYQQYEMECRMRFGVPSPVNEPSLDFPSHKRRFLQVS